MKTTAIILAAGHGRRMNLPVAKQFLNIQGKPMIYHSINAFERSNVDEIILVTGTDQVEFCKNLVSDFNLSKVIKVVEGGEERYDSVYNALVSVEKTDYVLIHDGARPFITIEKINEIIDAVIEYKACIICTPVKETIKIADADGYVSATPPRNSLWTAQTPQAFDYDLIRKAYDLFNDNRGDGADVTDDSMVYERYTNLKVKILNGDYNNIKVTTPEDLTLANQLAQLYLKG